MARHNDLGESPSGPMTAHNETIELLRKMDQALIDRLGLAFVSGTSSQPVTSHAAPPVAPSMAPTLDVLDYLETEGEFDNHRDDYVSIIFLVF
ncbi:hypothetical protein Syun_003928 [Stephania yunnanensis]|uniref:Uncharacterized protein n=1 Tax=Stephania yunnanensis TaxID=152371 RepID=A0AAP0L253_9MAGN